MTKRSYHQFCGVARALDILGERWTLLIVRDLLLGPMRYVDLLQSLEGITTNLLAARLKHLEAHGVVEKRKNPPPAAVTVYALTARGQSLRALVLELGRFGAPTMGGGPGDQEKVSLRWAMLSLMRRFRGAPRSAVLALHVGERPFVARMAKEHLSIEDGTTDAALTTIRGPDAAWLQWVSGQTSARALLRESELRREGPMRPFLDRTRAVGSTP